MVEDFSPYRVTENQEHAPGTCFVTGTPNGPFIDTGVYIPKERFGQLVLSKDFIEQAARELGLFADVDASIGKAYDQGYADGVKEELSGHLDGAVDQLGLAVDVLRSIRDAGNPELAEADDLRVPEEGGAEAAAGEVDSGSSVDDGAGDAAGQGDGDVGDEGPAGVPAGASDVDPFRV